MSNRKYYIRGMNMLGRPTFSDVMDEVKELLEDKNLEELSDVVHSACRYVGVPNNMTWILANRTAQKHAMRVKMYGCPRSARNHFAAGDKCCCKEV